MKKIFSLFVIALFSVSMFADTWTVVGSNATILGVEWSTTAEDNDMVQDGTYWYLAKSGFTNPSGQSLAFKVCKDHGWGTAYPSENYSITIPAGYTEAHFMFNTSDNSVACAYVFLAVGSSSTLFGAEWNTTTNDMTEKDGVFTWKKENVDLAAGTITLKVAANHAWTHAWPSDNYELEIATSGKYDVTITFDPAKQLVSANAEKKADVVVLPTIKLGGEWASWTAGTAFTPAAGNETASTTIHFDEGQVGYSFKVVVDGNWLGHAKISETKPFTFDRGTTGARGWSGDDAAYIWIDKAGDYEFTWTYATDSLSVVYPTLANSAVTISAPEHVTISVKNGEEAIGATVQELTQLTITASADAGYRVMSTSAYLTAKTDSTFTITDNKLLMPGDALTITAEVGLVDGYYLVGDFNDVPAWGIADLTPSKKLDVNPDNAEEYMIENVTLIADDSLKIANVVDNAIKWYAPNEANYVVDSDHAGSSKTVYFRPAGDGDAKWWYNCIYVPDNSGGTAIDNTAVEAKAVKRIVNGQLVIEREGKLFNALGAEVK